MFALAALSGPLPKGGVVLVALLAAGALLASRPRDRAVATGGALVLAPVLLLADIWHSPQLHVVHRHPLYVAVAAVVAVAALVAAALAVSRRPWLLGPLAIVALPFRIPIQAGGTTSNLLVPLYAVVGVGALALVWRGLRDRALGDAAGEPTIAPSSDGPLSGTPRWQLDAPRAGGAPGWVARLLA
jgi:hypothetical protein